MDMQRKRERFHFAPISIDDYVALHMKANRGDDPRVLKSRLKEALPARKAGATCECGEPIWVIGAAVSHYACFSCITGEAVPDDDYEIAGA